jgi:hypothetical protein
MPMDGALRIFVLGTAVTNTVVFGARAVLYVLGYMAVGDLRNGDFSVLGRIHTYRTWTTIDWWATIVSALVLGRLLRRWMDAGNANAMTRPDVGLGWFRSMPSSKPFQIWQWAQAFGYILIVLLNIAFHNSANSDDQLRAWAVLEVMLCAVVIAASIGAAVEARHMTAQLRQRIEWSEEAERAEPAARAAEPDPIA